MTLAVIYEALRLRDLVMTLPKLVAEDTMIPYTTWTTPTDSPTASPIISHHQKLVKAGSHVIIDSPACSRNPFAWSDPDIYDPTRWLEGHKRVGDTGIENFTGLSSGARVCIGKRMAEVEMITVIAVMCKEWRMLPVAQEGEGVEEMKARMMKGSEELNLQPPKFGLKLEKRV
jgi:cytochrome P450